MPQERVEQAAPAGRPDVHKLDTDSALAGGIGMRIRAGRAIFPSPGSKVAPGQGGR